MQATTPVDSISAKESFVPVLSAPGHIWQLLEDLSRAEAPRVFIDLEFPVPAGSKTEALEGAVQALRTLNWRGKTVSARVNGLDSLTTFDEIAALVGLPSLDAILFPMARTAGDIAAIDRFIDQKERAANRPKALQLEVLVETARGLLEIKHLATASPRITTLHFGPGDFAKEMGMGIEPPGTAHPNYGNWSEAAEGERRFHPGDIWGHSLSRVAMTARAFSLLAFDGPFTALTDLAGYREQCQRAKALGLSGKWALSGEQMQQAKQLGGR